MGLSTRRMPSQTVMDIPSGPTSQIRTNRSKLGRSLRTAIVAMGSPRELIDRYSTREVLELRFPAGTNEEQAAGVDAIGERAEILPDRLLIYADDGEVALKEVHNRGIEPESALVRRSSLEDVFLRLTGRTLVD